MQSNTLVYVAGLLRGVRPIGFWSISITLSRCSIPERALYAPGDSREPYRARDSAGYRIRFTSVDLPAPETPVTAMTQPSRNSTSTSVGLFAVAPGRRKPFAFPRPRLHGTHARR